jgi:hypothetical protein
VPSADVSERDRDWPLPSESPRVALRLHVAEGAILGGYATGLVLAPLAGLVRDALAGSLAPADLALPVVALFAVAIARRAYVVQVARETTVTLRPARRDWRETRSWGRVALVALVSATFAGVTGVLAGGTAAVGLAGFGLAVAGTALLWYCWHRLGGALV